MNAQITIAPTPGPATHLAVTVKVDGKIINAQLCQDKKSVMDYLQKVL